MGGVIDIKVIIKVEILMRCFLDQWLLRYCCQREINTRGSCSKNKLTIQSIQINSTIGTQILIELKKVTLLQESRFW
jgi:hypothetical protein